VFAKRSPNRDLRYLSVGRGISGIQALFSDQNCAIRSSNFAVLVSTLAFDAIFIGSRDFGSAIVPKLWEWQRMVRAGEAGIQAGFGSGQRCGSNLSSNETCEHWVFDHVLSVD
jgi:hypothetical protein